MKYIFLFISFSFLGIWISGKTYGQHHSLKIYTSYAIGKPDKNYDFLRGGAAETVKRKFHNNTPDDEYAFGLGYSYRLKGKYALNFDIGYAKLVQDFLLPANGQSYFMVPNKVLYWRKESTYQIVQISPGLEYTLSKDKIQYGIVLQAIANVVYRKTLKYVNLSRDKIGYFATELYPGIFAEYKGIRASLGVRALHLKNRDDALANNGLSVDPYNSFKVRFTLSYRFLKW